MFEKVLKEAVRTLDRACAEKVLSNYALIGGLAVSRWGNPRATVDIDFIIATDRELEFVAKYLDAEYRKGSTTDPLLGSITFNLKDELGEVPIQLLRFPKSWEETVLENIKHQKIGQLSIPIVNWDSLILLKLYAGGALDLQDAQSILKVVQPGKKELQNLTQAATRLRVSRKLEKLLKS